MKTPHSQYWGLLIDYLKPQWPRFLLMTLLLFSSIGLQLINPLIVRHFIDTARSTEALQKLIQAGLLFIGVGLMHQAVSAFSVYVSVKNRSHHLSRLEVERLTYHYPDTGRGIENINLSLEAGTVTVITGRVGSGKTTLLEVLLGHLPRDTGNVYWNGKPIADPASFLIPPRCAYTPQVPRLFSDALRENILMGLPEDDVNLPAAIWGAVMEDDLKTFESGLDTVIGPRGVRLSGGQLQRTAAARMLVREPELLVFDDVSSALDVETEQKLWSRVFERREPTSNSSPVSTYLVVSHRPIALQHADNIVVLKDGRIEAEGRLEVLLETCEEMQGLWRGNMDVVGK